ncbi:hypothetical protein G647_07176 [Cladophialophora carrionii CBS 160.54]|uniref:Transcription factor domain-containing protein n=1 Tax=Cladophialophora carrionii CBS 160.54 TaxID=1279043 RepID=V9D1L7_9EURO|nr:uncharacterized protein G647_07176 [Cladophialophora carrionii CBS 160.54]ETI20834.1 hypothetical protein G647_07176 [Cladophialophora carrionii CBS 160.54]
MEPRHSPGFMKYATTLSLTVSGPLMAVISEAILYDSIQEAFLSNRLTWFGVQYVCDARNWTQHQIMSLPSSAETSTLTLHTPQAVVFDAVRYALIVYSLIAILPLPLCSVPFPELADRLEPAISQTLQYGAEATSTTLLLWISSMAALAAIGTPKRASLVAFAARLCRNLRIDSWESMQTILQDYLWSGDISDFDGMYLFLEVQKHMFEQDGGTGDVLEYEMA